MVLHLFSSLDFGTESLLEIKEKKAKPDLGNTELKENRDTLKNSSLFLKGCLKIQINSTIG